MGEYSIRQYKPNLLSYDDQNLRQMHNSWQGYCTFGEQFFGKYNQKFKTHGKNTYLVYNFINKNKNKNI